MDIKKQSEGGYYYTLVDAAFHGNRDMGNTINKESPIYFNDYMKWGKYIGLEKNITIGDTIMDINYHL